MYYVWTKFSSKMGWRKFRQARHLCLEHITNACEKSYSKCTRKLNAIRTYISLIDYFKGNFSNLVIYVIIILMTTLKMWSERVIEINGKTRSFHEVGNNWEYHSWKLLRKRALRRFVWLVFIFLQWVSTTLPPWDKQTIPNHGPCLLVYVLQLKSMDKCFRR